MKKILVLWILIVIGACNTPYGYKSKGFFLPGNSLGEEAEFATVMPYQPNSIPKITQGFQNYFVWKTIKYNEVLDNGESFSSYKTLHVDDLDSLTPEEVQYLRTAGHLLNNYLFFIDDYRFIYLSEDDRRNKLSDGIIPLYFDNDHYKLRGERKEASKQLIRGYYHVDGDQLFLDFGGLKHFYIKATYQDDNIVLDSIFIPEKRLLKASGLNNPYSSFQDMLSDNAQPIFEMPVEGDLLVEPDFTMAMGFTGISVEDDDRHPLHNACLALMPDYDDHDFETIDTVIYDFTDEFKPVRTYILEVITKNGELKTIEIDESLEDVITW